MERRLILLTASLVLAAAGAPSGIASQEPISRSGECTPLQVAAEQHAAARRAGTLRGTPSPGWTGMVWRGSYRIENDMPVLDGPPEVTQVVCNSPAHRAGLRAGDVILRVNGSDPGVIGALANRRPGQRFELQVRRGTRVLDVSFVSIARPPELLD